MNATQASDEALSEVLRAEKRAREQIAECDRQAAERIEAARAEARHIQARADTRIGALQGRCRAGTDREIQALTERLEQDAAREHDWERALQAMRGAVQALAERLTSDAEDAQ